MHISGVDIHSVAFGPGQVEISYGEERDNESGSGILEIRTLVVPVQVVQDQVYDALDSVRELLDAALVVKRAPRPNLR